jgi:hypothetical protein
MYTALFFLKKRLLDMDDRIISFFTGLKELRHENTVKIVRIFKEDDKHDKVKCIIVMETQDHQIM